MCGADGRDIAGPGKCVLTYVCIDVMPVACLWGLLLNQSLQGGHPKCDDVAYSLVVSDADNYFIETIPFIYKTC